MSKRTAILIVLSLLLLCASELATRSQPPPHAASPRGDPGPLPVLTSPRALLPAGNIADGMYTVVGEASHRCLEVATEKIGDRTPVLQSECSPGKASQKWSMTQYGVNLEIREAQSSRCLDILRKGTGNYAPIFLQSCNDGPNQRWRLKPATLNNDQGIICRASPAHPPQDCAGVNDQQKPVALGKTLTKARCEDVCRVNKLISCHWEGSK